MVSYKRSALCRQMRPSFDCNHSMLSGTLRPQLDRSASVPESDGEHDLLEDLAGIPKDPNTMAI